MNESWNIVFRRPNRGLTGSLVSRLYRTTRNDLSKPWLSRETKAGLVVGFALIVVFACLLDNVPPDTQVTFSIPDYLTRHAVDLIALFYSHNAGNRKENETDEMQQGKASDMND